MMKMRKKIRKRARMKNRTEIVRKQMMSTVSPSVTYTIRISFKTSQIATIKRKNTQNSSQSKSQSFSKS